MEDREIRGPLEVDISPKHGEDQGLSGHGKDQEGIQTQEYKSERWCSQLWRGMGPMVEKLQRKLSETLTGLCNHEYQGGV